MTEECGGYDPYNSADNRTLITDADAVAGFETLYFKQPEPVIAIDMGGMSVHTPKEFLDRDFSLVSTSVPVKATIDMGNLVVHVTRRFNWFHRTMMRLMFGWKVQNL